MSSRLWERTGLVMALLGAASLTQAQNPKGKGPGGKGPADGRGTPEEMLKKYDTNNDGQLSEEERAAMREQMALNRYDKDGDGQLSEAERATMREEMDKRGGPGGRGDGNREEMLKKYDKDGDGQLSEEERSEMRKDMQQRKNQE